MERIEAKDEKSLTIESDKHGGTLFKISHNLLDKHIILAIKNGSEPTSLIPITHATITKIAVWMTERANEIASL